MSGGWEGSDRKSRLPDNWPELVRKVCARAGGRCEWRLRSGARCPRRGTQCDHRRAGDNHALWNLQWLCADHHAKKSSGEGNAARRAVKASGKREPERHPGLR